MRELVSERTVRSKTWLLDSGLMETEIATVPMHYPDADGRLIDLDPTLKLGDDGFVPSASPLGIRIPLTAAG